MDISFVLSMVVSAAIASLVSFGTISFRLGKLDARTESNGRSIDRVETKFDNFLLGMSAPKNHRRVEVPPEIKKFLQILDSFLGPLEEKGNPVSPEQMKRLKSYRDKIVQGLSIKPEEYRDFQSLLKKVSRELPQQQRDEFDSMAAGLSGFVAGLTTVGLTMGTSRAGKKTEGEKVAKAELVEEVSDRTGLTKEQANNALDALTSVITDSLARGEKVSLVGFGTFLVQRRKARQAVNPQTGSRINIPAKEVPKFRPGRNLREAVE